MLFYITSYQTCKLLTDLWIREFGQIIEHLVQRPLDVFLGHAVVRLLFLIHDMQDVVAEMLHKIEVELRRLVVLEELRVERPGVRWPIFARGTS